MTVAERLKEERERLGLSQSRLGELVGVGKTTIINWEKGASAPDAVQLSAMVEAKFDVQYILTGMRMTTAPYAQAEPAAPLSARERALLDNYRHCSEEAQGNIDKTSALLAQQKAKRKMR